MWSSKSICAAVNTCLCSEKNVACEYLITSALIRNQLSSINLFVVLNFQLECTKFKLCAWI